MTIEEDSLIRQIITRGNLQNDPPVEELRATYDAMGDKFPVEDDVTVEAVNVQGIACERITPPNVDTSRVLIYLHGGGYVIGSLKSHRKLISDLARAGNMQALAVDYRLGPEHPYPAALEDAVSAYEYILSTGIKPDNIVIAGDSAGGGLALATLLTLQQQNTSLPAAIACLSPWTDLTISGKSFDSKAEADPLISRKGLTDMANRYLNGADASSPRVSPLFGDLTGLPALLIHVGTDEALLDDSLRLADAAKQAGVAVTLKQWPGMIHVFQSFAPMLSEGRESIAEIGEFFQQQIR